MTKPALRQLVGYGGKRRDEAGCGGMWWDAVGCGGMWWDVVGCGGMRWQETHMDVMWRIWMSPCAALAQHTRLGLLRPIVQIPPDGSDPGQWFRSRPMVQIPPVPPAYSRLLAGTEVASNSHRSNRTDARTCHIREDAARSGMGIWVHPSLIWQAHVQRTLLHARHKVHPCCIVTRMTTDDH